MNKVCPFCKSKLVESFIPDDMKEGYEKENWLICSGGCWIDGVSIPESKWPLNKWMCFLEEMGEFGKSFEK